MMIYRMLSFLALKASGRDCRRCAESIELSDPFGVSEGVCRGCRH